MRLTFSRRYFPLFNLFSPHIAKCVHRKCRCTYVKFHRQTAPAGPGHPMPPTVPTSVHGRHSISLGAPRLPDEFLLAPPPGPMSLAGMYAPAPHQYVPAVYASGYTCEVWSQQRQQDSHFLSAEEGGYAYQRKHPIQARWTGPYFLHTARPKAEGDS